MSRLPIPHFIERLFAEKADKPVIVTVTVDASGASMSAADRAKLTADMVMCWYNGDTSLLTSDVTIIPANGTATVTGAATSQTVFFVAFVQSDSGRTSIIPCNKYDIGDCIVFKKYTHVLPVSLSNNTPFFPIPIDLFKPISERVTRAVLTVAPTFIDITCNGNWVRKYLATENARCLMSLSDGKVFLEIYFPQDITGVHGNYICNISILNFTITFQ